MARRGDSREGASRHIGDKTWDEVHWTDHWVTENGLSGHMTINGDGKIICIDMPFDRFVGSGRTFKEEFAPWEQHGPGSDWSLGEFQHKPDAMLESLRMGLPQKKTIERYHEMREQIREFIPANHFKDCRRRKARRTEGDELDMDKFLGGHEACWLTRARTGNQPIVTFGFNIAKSWMNDENSFLFTVATCAAMAQELLSAGYRVRMKLLSYSSYERYMSCIYTNRDYGFHPDDQISAVGFSCDLLEFGSPMDEMKILATGAVGLFRVCGFANHSRFCRRWSRWKDSCYPYHNGLAMPPPDEWLAMAGIDSIITLSWTSDEKGQKLMVRNALAAITSIAEDVDYQGETVPS